MKAIDLYSGIGGWTLGLKMAGIEVISSYEWWKDANITHNKNFGTNHKEKNIRTLDLKKDLPKPKEVDFVVGSPPCTQFSFANRGGNGDLVDGLIDIYKFLEIVEYLKPKYWAMENVPRVAGILEAQIHKGGALYRFKHLFETKNSTIEIYNSADFGVAQSRKRMIAGNFPKALFESYMGIAPRRNLRDIVDGLKNEEGIDPIYGHHIKLLTDHVKETPLTKEEERINCDAKSYHPVYNKMSFPDDLDRPSRTVTALCTRVSRESIVIQDEGFFRRLTVRERGCVQSFPADYQFYSNSYGGKLKMIGNAVPPLLTYYLAQSMLEVDPSKVKQPKSKGKIIDNRKFLPRIFEPEQQGSKYTWSRSFWLAIPGLRFGSGVRFELRNVSNKDLEKTFWRINFFYGNSKKIKQLPLDKERFDELWESFQFLEIDIDELIRGYIELIKSVDLNGLQEHWINKDRNKIGPIWLVDEIGKTANQLIAHLKNDAVDQTKLSELAELTLINGNGQMDNKKLANSAPKVLSGIILGSIFNALVAGDEVNLSISVEA